MTIALWVVQVLLAAVFTSIGLLHATTPIPELALQASWSLDTPVLVVRFIGVAEVAGAIGMILPALTRLRPALTPLAGLGLATIMALAAIVHVVRGEFGSVPVNLVLLALAAFVAWGRTRKAPIAARA